MGICEPMTWFWGNLTASKDDNKDKDKDQQKIKWSNCNVILYLCSSVLTAIWMICYITNEFAAFFGAFIICVSISIYSLIHFRDLFGIDNEVNEATDHCTTMQTQEKELEAEIKQLETIANEMKTTTAGIETETKTFSHENKDYESKLDTLENTVKLLQQKKNQFKEFVDELKDDSQQKTSELKTLAEQVNDLLDFIKRAILEKEYNIFEEAFHAAQDKHAKTANIDKDEFRGFLEDLPNGFKMKILGDEQDPGKRFDVIAGLGEDDGLVNLSELQLALNPKTEVN